MKAYLTFARRKEENIHMLGLPDPLNICELIFLELQSGQPILPIIHEQQIIAFYIIDTEGNLYQMIGDTDFLFELSDLHDLTLINLQKYNLIQHFVSNIFNCLSIQEAKYDAELYELLEEKIFYNLLHIEIDIYKIKNFIEREIKKTDLSDNMKNRLINALRNCKIPNKKILKKKIDVDLSGYSVKINALIQ